jgi:hypothetical protein
MAKTGGEVEPGVAPAWMQREKTVGISLRMGESMLSEVDEAAGEEKRTRTGMVLMLVAEALAARKAKGRKR